MAIDYMKPLLGLLLAICLAALGVLILMLGGKTMQRGWDSGSWPATPAVVVRSDVIVDVSKDVVQSSSKSGSSIKEVKTYYPDFAFRYKVGVVNYLGERISFSNEGVGGSQQTVVDFLEGYPLGAAITVYVNPDDPNDAVLDPGIKLQGMGVVFLLASIFLIPGIAVAMVCVRSMLRRFRALGDGSEKPWRIKIGS